MEEKEFNAAESLNVINSMISQAKNKLADDGFLFIFWGWLVALAAMIHYASLKLNMDYGHFTWIILMPLGGVFSAVYGYREQKKKTVRTYLDSYLGYLWIAFGIGLLLTLVFMFYHGIKTSYFFLMILYGIATFISGGLLNFKPLVYGGIISFICAVISVFLGETEQLLIISIALLGSYIIPGHLLRAKFKSQQHV